MHGTARIAACALGVGLFAPSAANAIVIWPVNGHAYDVVFSDNPSWFQARDAAAGMTFDGRSGHLATFVTRWEQEFVIAGLGDGSALNSLWLGGYQDTTAPDSAEPYDGWRWITGEPWLGVAPDDSVLPRSDFGFNNTYFTGASEEYTITWWNTGGINDLVATPTHPGDQSGGLARGFIVEFSSPQVPEPGALGLFGLALAGLARRRRRAG